MKSLVASGFKVVVVMCGLLFFGFCIKSVLLDSLYHPKALCLKKHFGIELPDLHQFTPAEITVMRPVIEKRLNELSADYNSAADAFKNYETGSTNTNELFKRLVFAENNLKEACGAAKYFKLVPEDCEPCKAVK